MLCHGCGTPLWGDAGPPVLPSGSDAVDMTCTGCGSGGSFFTLTADPAAATRDPAEVRRDLEAARQRRLDEARDALAGAAFTAYGLSAGWSGRRWINGWGSGPSSDGSSEVLVSVNLVFGNPFETYDGGPTPAWAEIETRRTPGGGMHAEPYLMLAARSLASEAWHHGADLAPVQQSYRTDGDATAHWEPVEVIVAGRTAVMRRLTVGDRWWAVGVIGAGALITLKVRGLSPAQCRLVEVTDYAPFLTDRPLVG